MSIEQQLKAALARRDPGEAFTASVMSRTARRAAPRQRRWRVPLAFAASLVIALTGLLLLEAHRERQRLRQAQQLMLALEITSERLNDVQQRLHQLSNEENGT